ncbi:MAG TPA: hypothetical protein DCZ01_10595 [Elusimicrobia bacterium]|nr:MAG: hypothetical protein A2X37_11725 [Elusimicrobia bacterium GWA2_66_18]HAZ08946.1 hypothetical protein [Elusimicrobiota bacterium]
MKARSRGFSLVELLIAVSLGAIILAAIFGLTTSMVRFQIEGLRKGTTVGWSLASLTVMNKEFENADVLVLPNWSTFTSDAAVGCTNWSRIRGGRHDTSRNALLFYYCLDTSSVPNRLRRMSAEAATVTCPTSPPPLPACDATGSIPGPGVKSNDVIATNVYKNSGSAIFTSDSAINGLRIKFVIGEETYAPTAGQPDLVNPQFIKIDTLVTINRAYMNTFD